jgi:hypothetical protein
MKYINIKNLEEYHPGYKDRELRWCKAYFTMINADHEFEMLCEIDKWRFMAFIMLELQLKKPIPLDEKYLERKGFDFKKRNLMLTLGVLQKKLVVVTEDSKLCNLYPVTQRRGELDVDVEVEVDKRRGETPSFDPNVFLVKWNDFRSNGRDKLPRIESISNSRLVKLRARLKDSKFDFDAILKAIDKQPWLFGNNDRGWIVNFDWLIENDTNYLKVLELKYEEICKNKVERVHNG